MPRFDERQVVNEHDGTTESVVLLVQLRPRDERIDDADLIITNCDVKNIWSDNIGYSYSYSDEVVIVKVDDLSHVCLHVWGNKRKHISSFSVSAHLKTEEEALDYQMGGAKNNINSYTDNSMDSSYSSSFDDTKNSYQQDDTSNVLEVILNIIVEIVKFVA